MAASPDHLLPEDNMMCEWCRKRPAGPTGFCSDHCLRSWIEDERRALDRYDEEAWERE